MTTKLPTAAADQLRPIADLLAENPGAAANQLRELLRDDPLNAAAYRLLADALAQLPAGSVIAANVSAAEMRLAQAARALQHDDLETAEIILRPRLRDNPADVTALRLLADFAFRLGYGDEAAALLRLVIEIAPVTGRGEMALASQLYRRNQPAEAIGLLDHVLATDPRNLSALNLKAAALARAGDAEKAAKLYKQSLGLDAEQAKTWSRYGQVLRTLGRMPQAIAASRRAIAISPLAGELWWSLSDLKTFRFEPDEIARMRAVLDDPGRDPKQDVYLHFALAKALEDSGHYEDAFGHYAAGNRLQRRATDYDPDQTHGYAAAARSTFTPRFFAERAGSGCETRDPIFIVGMPRSGSTLLEQILGSHPEIEATMELPELLDLGEGLAPALEDLPARLAGLPLAEFQALGQSYLDDTRRYRQTARPRFIDKMPNNWLYVPLIQLILPKATIIDIRRDPLDCCVSNFKQLFLNGQGFSTDLVWMGRYYADYLRFMDAMEQALPGRVYRLAYEQLIEDPEAEVRLLLDHLGVPFDPACLRFHEGQRTVRTASADQVRQPINRQGIGSWRPFEPWIEPLKTALGEVLADPGPRVR